MRESARMTFVLVILIVIAICVEVGIDRRRVSTGDSTVVQLLAGPTSR